MRFSFDRAKLVLSFFLSTYIGAVTPLLSWVAFNASMGVAKSWNIFDDWFIES